MKFDNSDKLPVEKINHLISRISGDDRNNISGIYLDETLMEFFLLKNEIHVPSISVGELDYATGVKITENLISVIPEYLLDHSLLEKRKPSSEQHSLHFIKSVPGRLVDFVHILRFDFKLSGGHGAINGRGDNQTFPPYSTDRLRYKSRLIPVVKGSDPLIIDSLRLKSHLEVDTDGKRFTSVFFDEFSTTEISIDFSIKSGNDIYMIPAKIYQFIPYDYFTSCMNIPDPTVSRIKKAAEIFEPLFFYLYFQYRERDYEIDGNRLSIWEDYIEFTETETVQRPLLHDALKEFFSHYNLYRDDELMLKGLRKMIVGE